MEEVYKPAANPQEVKLFTNPTSSTICCAVAIERRIFSTQSAIMLIWSSFLSALLLASETLACAGHENYHAMGTKRQTAPVPPKPADWAYEASFNWGRINPSERARMISFLSHTLTSLRLQSLPDRHSTVTNRAFIRSRPCSKPRLEVQLPKQDRWQLLQLELWASVHRHAS